MTDLTVDRADVSVATDDVTKSSGWWGIVTGIATEAAIFAYLLFSYYYMAVEAHATWPKTAPSLKLALPNTIVLIVSSFVFWWAEKATKAGKRTEALIGMIVTLVLGSVFIAVQLMEWHNKPFSITTNPYGSLYFTITGFHMAHVFAGLLVILALIVWMWRGLLVDRRGAAVSIGALYWHFVDVVWLTVFFTFYITPYLS